MYKASIYGAAAIAMSLSSVSAANDQPVTQIDMKEAISICTSLFEDAMATKAELKEAGWVKPDREIAPVYSEADAAALQRGDVSIIYVGPKSSFSKDTKDFPGSCQIAGPGNAVVAATAISAFTGLTAESHVDTSKYVFNSVQFVTDTRLMEVASINKENTAMRFQYAVRPTPLQSNPPQ